ncbi:putative WD domain, G-beta repeat [Balamuthia mandrillaris]
MLTQVPPSLQNGETMSESKPLNAKTLRVHNQLVFASTVDNSVVGWNPQVCLQLVINPYPDFYLIFIGHKQWITSFFIQDDVLWTTSADGTCRSWLIPQEWTTKQAGSGKPVTHNKNHLRRGVEEEDGYASSSAVPSPPPTDRRTERPSQVRRPLPERMASTSRIPSITSSLPDLRSSANKRHNAALVVSLRWNTIFEGHSDAVTAACLSSDGDALFTASVDKSIRCWEAKTGKSMGELSGHEDWVYCLQMRKELLYSGSRDKTIRSWDCKSGACLQVFFVESVVTSFKFNGHYCYSYNGEAQTDFAIKCFSVKSGKQVAIFEGHTGRIRAIELLHDRLYSCSSDNTLREWNRKTGQCINVYRGHHKPVTTVFLLKEELASASLDGTVRLWRPHSPSAADDAATTTPSEGGAIAEERIEEPTRRKTTPAASARAAVGRLFYSGAAYAASSDGEAESSSHASPRGLGGSAQNLGSGGSLGRSVLKASRKHRKRGLFSSGNNNGKPNNKVMDKLEQEAEGLPARRVASDPALSFLSSTLRDTQKDSTEGPSDSSSSSPTTLTPSATTLSDNVSSIVDNLEDTIVSTTTTILSDSSSPSSSPSTTTSTSSSSTLQAPTLPPLSLPISTPSERRRPSRAHISESCLQRSAIAIQKVWRGWRVRKRFEECGMTKAQLQARLDAFQEILKAEQAYVLSLMNLVRVYMEPLKARIKQGKPLISERSFYSIFSNIEDVLIANKEILRLLDEVAESWPFLDNIGHVLLYNVSLFKAYDAYALNYKVADNELIVLENDLQFIKFTQEAFAQTQVIFRQRGFEQSLRYCSDLKGLITLPLNHISKYEAPIRRIIKNTALLHKDYDNLIGFLVVLKELRQHLLVRGQESEDHAMLHRVEQSIFSERPLNLKLRHRVLLKEGSLKIDKVNCFAFLFNDMLVLCKAAHRKSTGMLRLNSSKQTNASSSSSPQPYHRYRHTKTIQLDKLDVRLVSKSTSWLGKATSMQKNCVTKIKFNVTDGSGKLSTLTESARDEFESWYHAFSELQRSKAQQGLVLGVFGVPLRDVLSKEGTKLPRVVTYTITLLSQVLSMQGLFVAVGDITKIRSLQLQFDKCMEIDMTNVDPLDAAALLRQYLLSLPKPICPAALYRKLVHMDVGTEEPLLDINVRERRLSSASAVPKDVALTSVIRSSLSHSSRSLSLNTREALRSSSLIPGRSDSISGMGGILDVSVSTDESEEDELQGAAPHLTNYLRHKILPRLPSEELQLLKYVVRFFAKVAQHAEFNGLTSMELALLFGPFFARPCDEDPCINDTFFAHKPALLLQHLIDNHRSLFGKGRRNKHLEDGYSGSGESEAEMTLSSQSGSITVRNRKRRSHSRLSLASRKSLALHSSPTHPHATIRSASSSSFLGLSASTSSILFPPSSSSATSSPRRRGSVTSVPSSCSSSP